MIRVERKRRWAKMMEATICLLLLSVTVWLPAGQASQGKRDVRVLSYNIRYGTANDGENHWEKRREFLVETIRKLDPDLMGTQETLAFQRDYLATALPDYDTLGVGRDDGALRGEMTALFYRRERFEKLEGGHLWLSETPDIPASKSWDTSLTRMATWVRLRDRLNPQAKPILFLNTHFDHRGQVARLESARLLRRRVAAWGADHRVIVTGDFNAGEDTPPYRAFFQEDPEGGGTGRSPLLDTFRVVHRERGAEEGTFSGFQPGNVKGPRIDWIAVDRQWKVRSATIDRTARNGQTPSDHFAITAIVE